MIQWLVKDDLTIYIYTEFEERKMIRMKMKMMRNEKGSKLYMD